MGVQGQSLPPVGGLGEQSRLEAEAFFVNECLNCDVLEEKK